MIIAIDGTTASGKGTIAKRLAAHYGFAHLDTGLLYRAVGMAVVRAGGDPADPLAAAAAARALNAADATRLSEDTGLRSFAASAASSKVAAIHEVRAALLKFQQDFCASPPGGAKGAVLDGRDIGTVIAPDADVKIFVNAAVETRAERRFKELQAKGEDVTKPAVLADLQERDKRDAARAVAPTKPAPDAIALDTTNLTIEGSVAAALAIVEPKAARRQAS
ncbi:MAG: (d)CMP kinase [Alphaproteobacteria bacterium]|nr:(d)CMP kinase [Alphaproteobacteria bacterium]